MDVQKVILTFPPPLFYVGAFAVGLIIERSMPLPIHPVDGGVTTLGLTIAGGLSVAFGVLLGPANAVRFLVRRTTLNPNKQASVFLTRGIYAFSRNPMYLGLFLIYFGVAALNRVAWPLATAIVPFILIDRIVIPFEEARMAERYGASYAEYRERVGKWLAFSGSAER